MRRFDRLTVPPVVFAAIGTLFLSLASSSAFEFHGGLVTGGVYVLAIQITLSLLLFTVMDDLQEPRMGTPRRDVGRMFTARGSGANAFAIRHAVASFYLWHFLPAFLLALGGSMSIAALAIGLFDRPFGINSMHLGVGVKNSELLLAAVLVAIALPQLRAVRPGFFGWTIGFSAGAVAAQIALDPIVDVNKTIVGWSELAAGLCVVGIVRFGIMVFLRRRKAMTSS